METLSNRRLVLRISDGQESRARRLMNGVPQGSILANCFLNVYISDIPTTLSTKLAYSDALTLAFTWTDWADVENTMTRDLSTLHTYYHQNRIQLNIEKTDHLAKMIAYFFIQNCFKCDYDHHNTEYCCVWQRTNDFVT